MKLIILIACLFSLNASATMDSNTNVFILSSHVQSGEYFIQKAPIIGCYGLPKGPNLLALTREYSVPSNLGCGGNFYDNINELICAKVLDSKESTDFSTFSEITLDISKCSDKSEKFTKAVRKLVKMSFATKSTPNPKLFLVK